MRKAKAIQKNSVFL